VAKEIGNITNLEIREQIKEILSHIDWENWTQKGLPTWAERPKRVEGCIMGINTTTGKLEVWNGKEWIEIS
jgi:hypothetical protein